MASPPKSGEELRAQAQTVYRGTVTDVRARPAGELTEMEADLELEEVEDALLPGDEGASVTLHFRRPGKTAPGTTGSFGQHSPLQPGARIRAYVVFDEEGRACLLEPNGWEPV
jgi:hypothetical protein